MGAEPMSDLERRIIEAQQQHREEQFAPVPDMELAGVVRTATTSSAVTYDPQYTIVQVVDGDLDFGTYPSGELIEKYLSRPAHTALFGDWSKRCIPGDMTLIGPYLVIRKADR
jgi:hypothetical protein